MAGVRLLLVPFGSSTLWCLLLPDSISVAVTTLVVTGVVIGSSDSSKTSIPCLIPHRD
jgi:hypothetical protein